MKTRKIIELSILAAIAVILHVVEAQLPPLLPVLGAKLGLANVMTLVCFELFGAKETVCLLFVRIALTTFLSGALVPLIMSVCGAVVCFIVMCAEKKTGVKNTVCISVIGAIGHNAGQIGAASVILKSGALWGYFPVLIGTGTLFGIFTGICADFLICRLRKIYIKDGSKTPVKEKHNDYKD